MSENQADVWRCDVTGNPVGTDARAIGAPPCECQGCRAAAAIAFAEDTCALTRAERDEQERLTAKWQHIATNRLYIMEAYHAMLGPVALEVAAMWDKAGVVRQHTSWGPEAFNVSGEQRAQWILNWEKAPKRRCVDLDNGIYEDDPPKSGREKSDLREPFVEPSA